MPSQSLKNKVVKGAVWTLMEKLSTQVVQFIVGMVLARLLTPNDYGTVALTAIFFGVANVLVDCGFGNALIQKKDADELDFNSVFYLNIALSIVAYVAMLFAAPWIAEFFKVPELVAIIRVSAICFPFNAVNAIQNAELAKKMLFHLSFRISLITSLTSAICGVTLALVGYGVWSLVWASLITGFVGVVARWFIIAWRPRLVFSLKRIKSLFSYGWKISVSSLLDQFVVNLNGLLIGRFYSKADLAYVNKGNALPQLAMSQVDETLGRVSFPALVMMQEDKVKLCNAMRLMIQCSTFLVFPLMIGVAVCSRTLIRLIYGAQWMPATPYMMLACFSFALWPFHTINLRGIMAVGRSDIFLKLEIIKKLLRLVVLLIAFRHGVFALMAASAFALGPLGVIINAWPNKRLLGYTVGMQMMDVMPTMIVCIFEAMVLVCIDCLGNWVLLSIGGFNEGYGIILFLVVKLVIQFVIGIVMFFAAAYIFRLKPIEEYVHILAAVLQGRFPKLSSMIYERFPISH